MTTMTIKIGEREIEFDSVFLVPIAKAGENVTVDLAEFGDAIIKHWLDYGIRQNLNDAAAPVQAKDPNVKALAISFVEKRLEKFAIGELRTHSGGGRTVDPVRAEAIDNAERDVRAAWKKANKKVGDGKKVRAEALARVENYPFYLERAKMAIEEREALLSAMENADDVV